MDQRGFEKLKVTLAGLWTLGFFGICLLVPGMALFFRCRSLSALFEAQILSVVGFTAFQALLSTGVSAALALPLGLWVGGAHPRARKACEFFLALPFSIPAIVAAMAWVQILGRRGWFSSWGLHLDWAYSLKAVIAAHVFFNIPWIALWVSQSRAALPQNQVDAAHSLGAAALARFRWILWPKVCFSFLSATTQTFIFCVMSFALVLILGGGPPVSTLETEIYSKIRFGALDLSGAIVCAVWEMILTLLPWCWVIYFQSRHERKSTESVLDIQIHPQKSWVSLRLGFCVFLVLPYLGVVASPLMLLLKSGFAPFSGQSEILFRALRVSTLIAISAAVVSLLTAFAAVGLLGNSKGALRRGLSFLFGLPSGVSVLALGLGAWLAYDRWIDPFSGSLLAIVLLQGTIFFPIAFKIFWPVALERRERLLEAARSLGGGPVRVFWTLEWPRWRMPVIHTFGMIVAASLGEVAAISLFYSENLVPLPLLISRLLNQYQFEQAQALSALLLLLCFGIVGVSFLPGFFQGRLNRC